MGQIDEILGQAGRQLSACRNAVEGEDMESYNQIMTLLVIWDSSNKTILTKEIILKRPRSTVVSSLFQKE